MPADSDDDYVETFSDDDGDAHLVSSKGDGSGRSGTRKSGRGKREPKRNAGGFEVTRSWENVIEDEDGTIAAAVEDMLDANKRRKILKDTTPLQRGIIRHVVLIIDLSIAMLEKDYRPTRHLLTVRYAAEFAREFFEQNPISQLAVIGMRDGLAVRISDMSGNPNDHIAAIKALRNQDPSGYPSLQNALEMARGALFHAPSHGTREVHIIFGSLITADPGDIHKTINELVAAKIQCSVIGLAAEVAICDTLVAKTNPAAPTGSCYSVALDEVHYRELIMAGTTPPATAADSTSKRRAPQSSLLMMGFPSRIPLNSPSSLLGLCACHGRPTPRGGGYLCPRCKSKVCSLPCACPVCGLTLILSTHLARSYHHLFPLRNWVEVSWERAAEQQPEQAACFACMTPFPDIPSADAIREKRKAHQEAEKQRRQAAAGRGEGGEGAKKAAGAAAGRDQQQEARRDAGVSESGRYACEVCGRFFCIDCDLFSHEIVHNCPGCQSREGELMRQQMEQAGENGAMEGVEQTGKVKSKKGKERVENGAMDGVERAQGA